MSQEEKEVGEREKQESLDSNVVQKVWLDRGMGKLCLCVSAKGLSITGIDDRRYWNHIPTDESR